MSASGSATATGRRSRTARSDRSPINQAAQIADDVADMPTRPNDDDIPDLDAAAIHLREAARLVNTHVPAAANASRRFRHTGRGIARRLQAAMSMITDPTSLVAARKVARLGTDGARRPDRIVHALDGLCEPVDAENVARIALQLWQACCEQLDLSDGVPDFLLGLDAGGIAPALALAQTSGIPFKIAWKLHLELPGAIHFAEPHSSRPDMYAYAIDAGARVLIVDDEITTGRTLGGLIRALRQAGAAPVAAVCLIEDVQQGGRSVLEDLGVPLVSLIKLA